MADAPSRSRRVIAALVGVLLVANFVFLLVLARHVSVLAVVLFVGALALLLPRLRGALPGWLRTGAFVLLLGFATVQLSDGDRAEIESRPLAFVGATVITGRLGATPIPDATVLVDGRGRILQVGPSASMEVGPEFEALDVAGKFLMPGLLNAHGHLLLPGRVPGEPISLETFAMPDWVGDALGVVIRNYPGTRLVRWQMERNVQHALRSGVTTLRGLGDPHYIDVDVRKRIETGQLLGPRLLAAGPVLCVTGGHAHQIGLVFDGPHEARRAVRTSLRREVDHIKIANTGGVSDSRRIGEAGELQMTLEEIEAVVDEAHRKNFLVAAHAESTQGVREALLAGVDSIEHGASLDDEILELFRRNPKALRGHTTLHPTLSVVMDPMQITDEVRANPKLFVMMTNGNMIREEMITGFRQALAGGVKIAVGTDAGIVDHGSVWMEMKAFVELGGVSNAKALHMGTLATAESIGVADVTGSVEVGRFADLLVLDANPLDDLATLAEPAMVVVSGVIVR
jgi:imidazolonepropionase-like amidohydrolase